MGAQDIKSDSRCGAESDGSGPRSPWVTVVIPVRNDPQNLIACLKALQTSRFTDYEVVVVDDASTDDTAEVARAHGARVIATTENAGPANARNLGCEQAHGEIVVFLDADVCVTPDTLRKFVDTFGGDPHVAAVFGSYDTRPTRTNLVSQYKNLVHHYVHQQGKTEASTFWSGCGGVRRDAFIEQKGFHAGYGRPCVEDIELGSRLRKSGERIVLNKEIQVTHRKHWSLLGMIEADVLHRAVPWTRLILRSNHLPNDLNLKTSHRISAAISGMIVLCIMAACWVDPRVVLFPLTVFGLLWGLDRVSLVKPPWSKAVYAAAGIVFILMLGLWGLMLWPTFGMWMWIPIFLLGSVVAINRDLFSFFLRERGPWFTLMMIPLHVLYYLYSSATFATIVMAHKLGIGRNAV